MFRKCLFILSALLLCFGEAGAFTIDEAVERALGSNHVLKRYKLLEDAALETVEQARSGFMPSVDLGYSYELHEADEVYTGVELSTASAAVSYNLFRGRIDVNRVEEAKARTRAAKFQRAAVEADVILAVKMAYIAVLKSSRDIETARESVKLFERQKRDTALFYREGMLAKNDLLSVEVDLSTARQRLLQVERNRVVAEKKLERRIGVEIEDDAEFTDFPGLPEVEERSFESLEEEMLNNRSELKALYHIKEAHEYGREAVAGGDLPRVDVVVSHARYGDSPWADGRDGGYNHNTSALLKVSWNIFDGYYREHKIKEATYRTGAVEEEIQDA
ncbi:MAG: TolC family protein, partial [Desulfobacterales bacterium]|nr:TolC family protein [Desulfobacterales bacterium]